MTTQCVRSAHIRYTRVGLAVVLVASLLGIVGAPPAAASSTDRAIDAQQFLYELNLARSNPAAFVARSGSQMNPNTPPAPPLALNPSLTSSALFKSAEMAQYEYFGHQSEVTGVWPNKLARDHGYPLPSAWSNTANNIESIYRGSSDPFRALVAFSNSPGHRTHLFGEGWFATHREIGVGTVLSEERGTYVSVHTAVVATSDVFVTGVVYDDANGNGRMDRGEGLGGVTVTAAGKSTTTNAGGGYAIKVTAGTHTVSASGGGLSGAVSRTVSVGSANALVDFVAGVVPVTDGSLSGVRLAGPDRYATAVEVSKAHYDTPSQIDTIVVATGTDFPDALAGAALAGRLHVPLLLTATGSLPDVTRDEILRLAPSRVLILGGTSAISNTVVNQIRNLGPTTTRLSGADRYATAAAISQEGFPTTGTAGTVIIATGAGFADALFSAPAAVKLNGPVLLTYPTHLPDVTRNELIRLAPDKIIVLGGTTAVNTTVFNAIKAIVADTTRISGSDRYATAAALSKHAFPNSTTPITRVYATVGDDYPDALTGAAAAAAHGSPLLLTHSTHIPSTIPNEVARLQAAELYILGGTTVFTPSLHQAWLTLVG